MLFNAALVLCALGSASLVTAACGEKADRVCFGKDGGQAQDGTLPNGTAAFWTMPRDVDCAEWMLPVPSGGTVLALAKHINPRVTSSVLFADIANAIDGGEFATTAQKQASLLGCGRGGGMFGVKANTTHPAYNTAAYKEGKASPDGILIKIVRAPV
ncbi:hypothetical protein B0T18DRAFT_443832 [Schizothecium vesticola]|uniref:Uncharacterized protein n=1 Tax=Schizothecium vesticola TaxID=314040 RepID=A0AA40F5P1_9PEZI|nr:hypothetical protein B0T18DRAFT_443832 [Schizothecium vesticola]